MLSPGGNSIIHHYGTEGGSSIPPPQSRRTPSTGNPFAPIRSPRNEERANNLFAVSGGDGVGGVRVPPLPPPRPQLPTSQNAEFQEAGFEGVLAAAVGLLQQVARAVAELNDAYNAAYNASAEADGNGWRDNTADLGEVYPIGVVWWLGEESPPIFSTCSRSWQCFSVLWFALSSFLGGIVLFLLFLAIFRFKFYFLVKASLFSALYVTCLS